ncbi:MAG: response regulator transcription factor [Firmicutes bacterium]|nr:response regulator transcription factor [Bacillota bacterium]MBR6684523.1 response regulator transcription factor [Bacillota bacterium]
MQILIVEDEVRLAEALAQILREQKYIVDAVYDGRDGYDYAASGQYDVIVLDVMLPSMDGFHIVRSLRKQHIQTPVLMLTAKDELRDKVHGLDCGADDYMTKPFAPEELCARIRALSRRQGDVILEEMTFDDLTLNLSTYDLSRDSKSVHLGFKEFEVLRILMANPHTIVPKDDLINKVWGAASSAEDNNVEAYISFLRKKFYFLGSRVQIGTIRKVGYRLEVSDHA